MLNCNGTYAQFQRKACTTSNGQRALTRRNIKIEAVVRFIKGNFMENRLFMDKDNTYPPLGFFGLSFIVR